MLPLRSTALKFVKRLIELAPSTQTVNDISFSPFYIVRKLLGNLLCVVVKVMPVSYKGYRFFCWYMCSYKAFELAVDDRIPLRAFIPFSL